MANTEKVSKYLSFNTSIESELILPEEYKNIKVSDRVLNEPLPLAYEWVIWEQLNSDAFNESDYANATKAVARFSSVQQFWWLWNSIPQPSELLTGKRMVRDVGTDKKSVVGALIIFKEGIQPMWEDTANANGGNVSFRLFPNSISPGELDNMWNSLVLSLIGNNLKSSVMINGVRLVDKLGGYKGHVRIEVWFNDYSNQQGRLKLVEEIETLMSKLLDGTTCSIPQLDLRAHGKTH